MASRWRRLFPRFGLRTLLIATTVFSVWAGIHTLGARRQEEAVNRIQSLGGWVRYDYQFDGDVFDANANSPVPAWLLRGSSLHLFHRVVEVNFVYSDDLGTRLDNSNKEELPLEVLKGVPKLVGLYMCDGQATDHNLSHVSELKSLKRFFVWDARDITDEGVAKLQNLRRLESVHIGESNLTDDSLAVFSQMPSLQGLSLQWNYFTDEGVRQLASLPRLKSLAVCRQPTNTVNLITDESLEFIFELDEFELLGVQHSLISDEFEKRMQERFPKSRIWR